MKTPTLQDIIATLEDAVMCEPGDILADTQMSDVSGWDSSSAVYFIGEALGQWGAEVTAKGMRSCESVPQLLAHVLASRG